ncbi:MAG: tetratricopeptide repeat protein [Sphingomonadaceae bacterium]|nr:tetratricopeptide repeat protein [Sphingomonadaceae bacterium]
MLATSGAQADAGRSSLADYARARVADASGELNIAARGYASALSEAPFDETLAARAYRRAIAAGDRGLALRAATTLQQGEALPPDGRFLFLIEAIDEGDWAEARRIVDGIEEESLFASLAPVLRAWIAYGARDGDPVAILDAVQEGEQQAAYAAEHRALLLLVSRREDEAVAALQELTGVGAARMLRLRLAFASYFADNRQRDRALTLIQGEGRALETARDRIERRRDFPGAIDSTADGIAEIFIRLAAEVSRRNATVLATTFARFSTFLAPDNSVGWLVTSAVLHADDQDTAAFAALDQIDRRDPFFADAQDARVRLLADDGDAQAALAIAQDRIEDGSATAADWQRLGEMHTELGRFADAANAYGRAVELAGGEDAPWSAWLLYGGALHDADRWDDAKVALNRSVELGPDQPLALNFLGYALLERREELERAEALIARASELRPDSASITDSLGWAHYVRGNLDQAIPTLERAAVGDPDEPTINEHLGDAYWTAGRRREARFAWQAALVTAEDDAVSRLRSKLDTGLTPETVSP